MALARKNELLLGVIYNPIYNELFTAARGEGAFFNGKRIHCSKIAALKSSLLCTGFPEPQSPSQSQYPLLLGFHAYAPTACGAMVLRRSILPYVAMGRFESFWEFGLNPWDTAAGVVLVEEAGGKITDMQGQPYQLGGPSILASNGLIHEEMVKVVAEVAGRTIRSEINI